MEHENCTYPMNRFHQNQGSLKIKPVFKQIYALPRYSNQGPFTVIPLRIPTRLYYTSCFILLLYKLGAQVPYRLSIFFYIYQFNPFGVLFKFGLKDY